MLLDIGLCISRKNEFMQSITQHHICVPNWRGICFYLGFLQCHSTASEKVVNTSAWLLWQHNTTSHLKGMAAGAEGLNVLLRLVQESRLAGLLPPPNYEQHNLVGGRGKITKLLPLRPVCKPLGAKLFPQLFAGWHSALQKKYNKWCLMWCCNPLQGMWMRFPSFLHLPQ